MDVTESGLRDQVFDILNTFDLGGAITLSDAAGEVVDKVVLPLMDFTLEVLGITRDEWDAKHQEYASR